MPSTIASTLIFFIRHLEYILFICIYSLLRATLIAEQFAAANLYMYAPACLRACRKAGACVLLLHLFPVMRGFISGFYQYV
jgi:hypothetical protein